MLTKLMGLEMRDLRGSVGVPQGNSNVQPIPAPEEYKKRNPHIKSKSSNYRKPANYKGGMKNAREKDSSITTSIEKLFNEKHKNQQFARQQALFEKKYSKYHFVAEAMKDLHDKKKVEGYASLSLTKDIFSQQPNRPKGAL